MMAMAEATAIVGWHDKEWGNNNASTTIIPLMTTKITRTTMKKEGDGIFLPLGDAAQEDWRRTAANGY
jgi:hypothetical protein